RKRAQERGVRFGRPRKLTAHQRDEARCSASGKARHRRTSPGATPWTRPPSADWQLLALSSTARPSPSEALGSALRPRRLSSEGDTMNIRLPAATEHPWTYGADGVAARAP